MEIRKIKVEKSLDTVLPAITRRQFKYLRLRNGMSCTELARQLES